MFAWGYNSFGESTVPPGLTNVVDVACGGYTSMALRADGMIVRWGDTLMGQRDVPTAASNVVAIAISGYSAMALRGDGSVLTWGFTAPPPPPEATNIVAIACGAGHGLALREDGKVVAWGENRAGQCDVPRAATNIVAIAASLNGSVALTSAGAVLAWGDGAAALPATATNIVQISAGLNSYLGLRNDRTVVSWGEDWGGDHSARDSLTDAISIAAGLVAGYAVRADGTVAAWGRNNDGELDVPPGLAPAWKIEAGEHHALGIRGAGQPSFLSEPSDRVAPAGDSVLLAGSAFGLPPIAYQWRRNGVALAGQSGPRLLLAGVQAIDSGDYEVTAQNALGASTSRSAKVTVTPAAPKATVFPSSQAVSLGDKVTFSVDVTGTLPLQIQWHHNGVELLGESDSVLVLPSVSYEAAGQYQAVVSNESGVTPSNEAVLEVDSIVGWGENPRGARTWPLGLGDLVAIAAGYTHSLGLRSDGSLIAWGSDDWTESTAHPWISGSNLYARANWCRAAYTSSKSQGSRKSTSVFRTSVSGETDRISSQTPLAPALQGAAVDPKRLPQFRHSFGR